MFIVVKMGSTNVVVTVVGTAADKVLKVLELTHSAWFNVFVVHVSPGLQKNSFTSPQGFPVHVS